MAILVISILALLATAAGVYYSRGQLQQADAARDESRRLIEQQQAEDNLWADKYLRAGTLLCRIGDTDRLGVFGTNKRTIVFPNGVLGMLFTDNVYKHIMSQLIERQDDQSCAVRPMDVSQLRLKANRDLIDLVLATVENFQQQKPGEAKELGL
jgi:type II secretory pathway pseudopilin PulG